MHKQIGFISTFSIALLLIIFSFAIADTTEEAAEAVETPEPKKSPVKIGGAMRANYVYGTYEEPSAAGKSSAMLTLRSSALMQISTTTVFSGNWSTGFMTGTV